MKTLTLNNETFDKAVTVGAGDRPVLVDFWAPWCGPCKMAAPLVEEVAVEQADAAVVAKVNVDEAPELAARYGITAIPTLVVFKNGKPSKTLVGVPSKSALHKALAAA